MPSSPKQELDILLIGKTGHGKSSTGNSILNRNEFKTSSKGTSATYDVHMAWTDFEDYTIKVVDGPGVGETRLETVEATQKACDDMAKAMTMCPKGFHALLLVLHYGLRFTQEEAECIAMLKSIFGRDIVQNYCIVVFTHGENFDPGEEYEDFSDWLQDQDGALKELFIECRYRCVLMQNKTRNKEVKENQMRNLMKTVHSMKYRDVRYTNGIFASAQQERDRLMVEVKAPELKEEIMQDTSLILSDLTKIKENDNLDQTDTILLRMEERVIDLLHRITTEDNQTGVLNDLRNTVSSIQQSVIVEKAINKQRKEDRKIQDQMKREHEESIAKLKLGYAKEQRKLEEQMRTASDAERGELENKLLDITTAGEEKVIQMTSAFNKKMEQTKKEEEEKWKNVLDRTRKDHDQQMAALQSQYQSMKTTSADAIQKMQAVSEQLRKLQSTKPPLKDPTKTTLYCQDMDQRMVSVTVVKTSPIGPLMEAYYGLSKLSRTLVRFYYDGNPVQAHQTPNDLQLGSDAMFNAFYEMEGGIPIFYSRA